VGRAVQRNGRARPQSLLLGAAPIITAALWGWTHPVWHRESGDSATSRTPPRRHPAHCSWAQLRGGVGPALGFSVAGANAYFFWTPADSESEPECCARGVGGGEPGDPWPGVRRVRNTSSDSEGLVPPCPTASGRRCCAERRAYPSHHRGANRTRKYLVRWPRAPAPARLAVVGTAPARWPSYGEVTAPANRVHWSPCPTASGCRRTSRAYQSHRLSACTESQGLTRNRRPSTPPRPTRTRVGPGCGCSGKRPWHWACAGGTVVAQSGRRRWAAPRAAQIRTPRGCSDEGRSGQM
jgi:hypothetical protein